MRKSLVTLLFLLVCQSIIHAQNWLEKIRLEKKNRDSLKIEALKERLQMAKDTARINCLNDLAITILDGSGDIEKIADSAFFYADLASREALQTGYKYGEAQAYITIANAKWWFNQERKECETNIKRALTLAIELNDDLLMGKSYLRLGRLENPVENYLKAVTHLKKSRNIMLETEATIRLCMAEIEETQYETGFPYCEKCVELAASNVKENASDEWAHEMVAWSYMNISDLYLAAGEYPTALEFLSKANDYAEEKYLSGWLTFGQMSEIYSIMGNQDSALIYWNRWKKDWNNYIDGHRIYGNNVLAKIYIKKNQPDSALSVLENSHSLNGKRSKKYFYDYGEGPVASILMLEAEAYLQKKDYNKALTTARNAVHGFELQNYKTQMMNGYQLLSSVYYQLGRHKDAYENLLKYHTIKDSIQSRQFLIRLNNYKRKAEDAKKETRIGFLNRENQIKQQQLKQETTFRNFLIAAFVAIIFAGLYVFRNINLKRKNELLKQEQKEHEWKVKELESENRHIQLQRQSAELEMQALRAQMNPHFIFNCLSSINRFILKNESKVASNYLTRFSRLMRMVLNNSQKPLISLDDELEMLELYLEMERLRFKNSFDYGITFLNTVDSDNIFIPPLLLQPFCENAIWHGLMHKNDLGRLDIRLTMHDNILNCVITDNGVGREKAEELNTKTAEKEKSMGLRITTERLALFNREQTLQTNYRIEDLKDEQGNAAGTKVTLQVYFRKSVETLA